MWLLYVGLVLIILLGAYCWWKVPKEYESQGILSKETAVAVWALYAAHTGVTGFAASRSMWVLPINKSASVTVGRVLVIFGAGLALAGIITFRSLRRMSGMETNRLVSTGIYRWTRNPQNVGWGLFLLGIAFIGRSFIALLLVILFWVLFRVYLIVEERYLEGIFGEEYRQYCERTPRFFGWPKRKR